MRNATRQAHRQMRSDPFERELLNTAIKLDRVTGILAPGGDKAWWRDSPVQALGVNQAEAALPRAHEGGFALE